MFGNKINPPEPYQGQTVPLRGLMFAHRQRVGSPSLTQGERVFRNCDCRGQRLRKTEQLASYWPPQCFLILAYFIFLANVSSISLSLFNTSSFLIISVSRSLIKQQLEKQHPRQSTVIAGRVAARFSQPLA